MCAGRLEEMRFSQISVGSGRSKQLSAELFTGKEQLGERCITIFN